MGSPRGLVAFVCFTGALVAAEAPKPDPAAHTVIVPYDAKQKPDPAKAARFYLDYADFQRLWALAKENRKPEKPEVETGKPEASINSALYDAEVLESSLRVKARFSVVAHGGKWAKLPLPFKSEGSTLAISDVKLDGHAAVFQNDEVLIEETGAHTVDVTVEVKTGRAWKSAALTVPRASAAMLSLAVPTMDGRPLLGDALGVITEESRDGRRIFTVPLGSATSLNITRSPARRLVEDAAPALAETTALLRVLPRMEEMDVNVAFSFPGTERKSLTVELDPALRLVSAVVTPAGLATLRKDGGKQFLDVSFLQSVAGSAAVEFWAVRMFGDDASATGARLSPLMRGIAGRDTTMLELRTMDEFMVKADAASAGERLPTSADVGTGEQVIGAWRLKPGMTLPYTVGAAENRSVARMETLHQLSAQKAEIIAAITLDSGRAPLAEARIGVPAGFEVQTLTGPRVVSWHREGDELRLRFDEQPQREARLVLHLAKTLTQASATWTLEALKLPQFAKQEGTVLIAAHAADEAKLTFDAADRKMREVDPGTLQCDIAVTAPMQVKRALRVEKPDWTAQVTLARQAPRFSVDAVLLAQAGDLGLRLSQQVGVNVEQGAVASVKLRLPQDLPEARVRGAAVRDAQSKIVNGAREYDVTFQTEALDRVDFTLDLDLPLEGEKVLPVLQVDGTARVQRFVIVDNAGAREMKLDAGGSDSAAKESVPYLPDGLTRPQFFRARDSAAIKLAFTQLESTAGNAAIVTLADITTALRRNGERWETVVYSLANRSLQFLPVRLPERAELVEVSVGGKTVRADRSQGSRVKGQVTGEHYLVPLIQMRAGELSQQVRLVYRVPADGKGVETTRGLDDPELVGLSAERTLWHVWVPKGYEARKFDGNMEEVGEEGQDLEKQQSLLSEVSRLNRLMSSKEVSYEDAKLAQDNANKALQELRQKAARKTATSYDREVGKQKDGKDSGIVSQLEGQVNKQLEEQGRLLTANGGQLEVKKVGTGQWQNGVIGVIGGWATAQREAGNTWGFNNAAATKTQAALGNNGAVNSLLLNDNAGVSNDFFTKTGDGTLTMNKSGAGTLSLTSGGAIAVKNEAQVQQGTANIALNNARGQAGYMTEALVASSSNVAVGTAGVVTVNGGTTLTLTGANTYTGATTISGGTLQVGTPVTGVPVDGQGVTNFGSLAFRGTIAGGSGNAAGMQQQLFEQARELAKNGRYSDAKAIAAESAKRGDVRGQQLLADLNNPDRYEPALTPEHAKDVQDAERKLQMGYSFYNLGDYDKASKSFQDVLRVDPTNSAARRGIERAEQKRAQYFDTARDQQRSKMLNEVNQGWEEKVNVLAMKQQRGEPLSEAETKELDDLKRQAMALPAGRPVAANAPAAAADPFAAPATPAAAKPPAEGKPAEQPVAGRLFKSVDEVAFNAGGGGGFGVAPQLKPVGRVSLAVDVPLEGTAFHFRKLKDHALLDVSVVKPWEPREKAALWALLGGGVIFGGAAWRRKRK